MHLAGFLGNGGIEIPCNQNEVMYREILDGPLQNIDQGGCFCWVISSADSSRTVDAEEIKCHSLVFNGYDNQAW